jgi:hypothetical protein
MEKPKVKFKCRKTTLYRSCKMCFELNGGCDYSNVIEFRPITKRNRCPICLYKDELIKCEICSERKQLTEYVGSEE